MNIKLQKVKYMHLEKLRRWRMSKSVTRYMNTDPIITIQDQENWYRRISQCKDEFYWVIVCDEVEIGFLSITNINQEEKCCEIGHYIGDDIYRNKGISKIVEANICEYIFTTLKLKTIIFNVFEENIVARKLHEFFCATEDIKEKGEIVKNNNTYSTIRLCITSDIWEAKRAEIVFPSIDIQH